ncbi:hypothetical protein AAFF_G00427360 [Aldrovandia affinis]|uniref:Mucin-1 n=1 Tax=Aldrovandia affinis TaxID=143900 RepID=A0AAD7SBV8_9TELE|nr:hypothetical protein AAFF_G00427360 [Aldrovandia affinis]
MQSDTSSASIESAPQSLALAPADSTSVPTPVSVYFLCIKITNRDFKESLKDQSSEDYKKLRDEVTQLLEDVYISEPHDYAGISAMTFSKGSVVANTTVMFKTTEIHPSKVKKQFLSYVKKNPPQKLELNISYTEAGGNSVGVPGWAIALLVLASLILFFLILLIIILLVYWCYKRRQYGFVNMSEDPNISVQVNQGADIPMYTTHSHFESPNGKPYVSKPLCIHTLHPVI